MMPDQAEDQVPEQVAASAVRAPGSSSVRPPSVDSGQLFEGGQRELIILHQGEAYRLRITRQEKLILTK